MSVKRPHKGYRRLWALGSGIWDKASRSVMPLVYPKRGITVKSGVYRSSLQAKPHPGYSGGMERPRRLRSPLIRSLVAEVELSPRHLILPSS